MLENFLFFQMRIHSLTFFFFLFWDLCHVPIFSSIHGKLCLTKNELNQRNIEVGFGLVSRTEIVLNWDSYFDWTISLLTNFWWKREVIEALLIFFLSFRKSFSPHAPDVFSLMLFIILLSLPSFVSLFKKYHPKNIILVDSFSCLEFCNETWEILLKNFLGAVPGDVQGNSHSKKIPEIVMKHPWWSLWSKDLFTGTF